MENSLICQPLPQPFQTILGGKYSSKENVPSPELLFTIEVIVVLTD
jgi:hypothetical protein